MLTQKTEVTFNVVHIDDILAYLYLKILKGHKISSIKIILVIFI